MTHPDGLKLNLGGGAMKIAGMINIDILPLPEVDRVHDLNSGIPFPDSRVSEIYTSHFLEHVDDLMKMMAEIYRVCTPNALVKIKVPYFKSIGAFKDPTHNHFFTEQTFNYFDPRAVQESELPNYHLPMQFKVEKIAYVWSAPWLRFLPAKKAFFLKHFWNIARSIYFELRVIK